MATVSLTAGVEAMASALPALWSYRVPAALPLLLIIILLNLCGLRETGTLMAVPAYLFVVTYLMVLAYGVVRLLVDGPGSLVSVAPPAAAPLTALLALRTFPAGCTALTGIEAISEGGSQSWRKLPWPGGRGTGRRLAARTGRGLTPVDAACQKRLNPSLASIGLRLRPIAGKRDLREKKAWNQSGCGIC